MRLPATVIHDLHLQLLYYTLLPAGICCGLPNLAAVPDYYTPLPAGIWTCQLAARKASCGAVGHAPIKTHWDSSITPVTETGVYIGGVSLEANNSTGSACSAPDRKPDTASVLHSCTV